MRRAPSAGLPLAALVSTLVAGCAGSAPPVPPAVPGPETEAPATAPAPEVPAVLTDPEASLPLKRTRVIRFGAVRYSADGGIVNEGVRGDSARLVVPVIREDARRLQIVAERGGARLGLWIDRDDVATVATRSVRVALDRSALGTDAPAGVTLNGGAWLQVVERAGDAARVHSQGGAFAFEGWVPEDALGAVYVPAERAPPANDLYLEAGTPLLDAPGGRPIGRFDDSSGGVALVHGAVSTGTERDEHLLVEVHGDGFVARGWVHERFRNVPILGLLRRDEAVAGDGDLPSGTCFFAGADGPPIGVAVDAVRLRGGAPDAAGWVTATIPSNDASGRRGWGDLPVAVRAVGGGFSRCDGSVAPRVQRDTRDDA